GKGGIRLDVRHILKNILVSASQDYTLEQYQKEKDTIEKQARVRADEALKKLRSGKATFEAIFASDSDDPRKAGAGVLGAWKGRFNPEFDKAASALKKGEYSDVIKVGEDYRILQCMDITQNEEVHAQHILVAAGARA